MRIEDMIVVSDLDGTVIPGTGIISQENIKAVQRFREKGGTFTCASGRSPRGARPYCKALGVQGPAICANGAVIFDWNKRRALWSKALPPHYREIVRDIHQRNNPVGVELVTDDDKCYLISTWDKRRQFLESQAEKYYEVTEDELPDNSIKLSLILSQETMEADIRDIFAQNYPGVEFAQTGGSFFEMTAQGITKGYPLEILAGLYGKIIDNVVAIGDFYNDIEMLKKARFGATLENAPDIVKKTADKVFPSCRDNGVAVFLDYLIQHHNEI